MAGTALTIIRSLSTFYPDVTIEEQHQDQLVITDHPVEGSVVTDNAYKLPSELIVTYGWTPAGAANKTASPTFLNDLYAQILALQDAKTLFDVFTGRRIYRNMLLGTVSVTTDRETENALIVRLLCRSVNLVQVTTTTVPFESQAAPDQTAAPANLGLLQVQPAPNFNQTSAAGILGDEPSGS